MARMRAGSGRPLRRDAQARVWGSMPVPRRIGRVETGIHKDLRQPLKCATPAQGRASHPYGDGGRSSLEP
jgi:hypothetical protein